MEDRFKFRFWHKPAKKMLDVYGFNDDFVFAKTLDGVLTEYNPARLEDCVLMQCTALKDRNGELIYEGDIVEYTTKPSKKQDPRIKPLTENYKVVWSDRFTGYLLQTLSGVDCQSIAVVLEQIEIIGNVYKNPELLGE